MRPRRLTYDGLIDSCVWGADWAGGTGSESGWIVMTCTHVRPFPHGMRAKKRNVESNLVQRST